MKYCTVGDHCCSSVGLFSYATSSIYVKWELAYIPSTNIMTFSLSDQGTPIAMNASALWVSSQVYLVM